ncbi:alpha amylase C-terminal domain-containing protein, partial [bacterium]|nr:alpha amylase C-terminal domain-containing protein [bacterium]
MIRTVSFNPISFGANGGYQTAPVKENKKENKDTAVTSMYLDNLAMMNTPAVKRINDIPSGRVRGYKNNLRSMIQNNQSVMMAIVPRTFTAEDINGDDKISFKDGEKNGTFLSAISRLDELKADGINTIHILPIHPAGKKNAMGTAGSIYAPAKFLEKDGHMAYDPLLIDKNDPRTPDEQFKAFIDECHKRDIKVMLDIPSCASVDWFEAEPELMAFGRNGEDKTPQGWADIRMFEPWADASHRTLNPALYELHRQYVDNCIELGLDGIRADVARAKPTEFWDKLITYSHTKDPEFGWLGESYTYECASPQVNMPYDRPEDLLRAGFDDYYGQYHIFHDWKNATEFNDYIKLNLDLSHRLPSGKSVIGSFLTHDDSSSMIHGGENFCKMTTVLQSTIPMCNPYFVDGFQSGDYYDYKYRGTINDESLVENKVMDEHRFRLAIFNLSRKPGGNSPDIERIMKGCLKMRSENLDVLADRKSSFIELDKREDKNDQIITFARHNNGRTILVVANKNPNRNVTGIIEIPGLKADQKLNNMVPEYGDKSEFQVAANELKVNLAPADAYVFEIDTPNIETDR